MTKCNNNISLNTMSSQRYTHTHTRARARALGSVTRDMSKNTKFPKGETMNENSDLSSLAAPVDSAAAEGTLTAR